MNKYKAFGLIIESELAFDELLPCDIEITDLVIKAGKVPETFEDIVINAPYLKISRDKYWSDIKDVAKFYVQKGELILLEPYEKASFEEIKLYVLGSCMGAVLYQRRILPLHGSCVIINGKGILLTGEPGVGKSTVAAVLYKKGYKILTDDVTAVVLDEHKVPMAYPSFPSQKLWEDAIERVGIKEEKKVLNRISKDLYKYSVKSDLHFEDNPIPIKVVIEIISLKVDSIHLEEIKSAQKLEVVLNNTYRKVLIEAMDLREWYFHQCVIIADKVVVYRITRPQDQYLENEMAGIILEKTL